MPNLIIYFYSAHRITKQTARTHAHKITCTGSAPNTHTTARIMENPCVLQLFREFG